MSKDDHLALEIKGLNKREVITLKEIYKCYYFRTVWLHIFVNILEKMNNNTTKFAGNVELFKIYD